MRAPPTTATTQDTEITAIMALSRIFAAEQRAPAPKPKVLKVFSVTQSLNIALFFKSMLTPRPPASLPEGSRKSCRQNDPERSVERV